MSLPVSTNLFHVKSCNKTHDEWRERVKVTMRFTSPSKSSVVSAIAAWFDILRLPTRSENANKHFVPLVNFAQPFRTVVLNLFFTAPPVSTCPLFQAPWLSISCKSKRVVWIYWSNLHSRTALNGSRPLETFTPTRLRTTDLEPRFLMNYLAFTCK